MNRAMEYAAMLMTKLRRAWKRTMRDTFRECSVRDLLKFDRIIFAVDVPKILE